MNINWKVRAKNRQFWISFIPAIMLLIQMCAGVLNLTLDLSDMNTKLLALVDAIFAVLTILGIVNDPTTAGVSDSTQALTYDEPKKG